MAQTKEEILTIFHNKIAQMKPNEELNHYQRYQQMLFFNEAIEELYKGGYIAGYEDATNFQIKSAST